MHTNVHRETNVISQVNNKYPMIDLHVHDTCTLLLIACMNLLYTPSTLPCVAVLFDELMAMYMVYTKLYFKKNHSVFTLNTMVKMQPEVHQYM